MASITHLMSLLITQSRKYKDTQCHTLHDLYVVAKSFWDQQDYRSAYRVFYCLGRTHQYRIAQCLWYRVHCLIHLGFHNQAIKLCLTRSKSCPTESQWYLIASEIYIQQRNYFLAHEMLSKASNFVSNFNSDYDQIRFQKRIAYEAYHCIQTSHLKDIIFSSIFPYDVLICIFEFLDLSSLVRCTEVSKDWREFLLNDCPSLWSKLEFGNNKAKYIGSGTIQTLINRLGNGSLKSLSIRHQPADGDGVLLTLSKHPHYCRHLNTIALYNVLITPTVLFNALGTIGGQLEHFEWGGVSIWLNDLFENIPKTCTRLKRLVVYDCFTSVYSKDQFGEQIELNCLQTLQLSNIHGLKESYLEYILSHCLNLKQLTLNKSNVDINSITSILKATRLPELKHFQFQRNVFSKTDVQKITPDLHTNSNSMNLTSLKVKLDNTFGDSDLQSLLRGSQHSLQALDISGSILISDAGILFHQPYSKMEVLCLKECFAITSQGLLELIQRMPFLKSVDLSCLSTVNDAVLEELAKKRQIREINLENCKKAYSEECIRSLVYNTKHSLRKIQLTHCSLNLLLYITTTIKSDIV
ncbi:hypothetical protein BY458DRAFT_468611 [Sporodiniella umbellata]|nr:hypothetical protein BY458DRAFT_468611 [Sporodiniella umbellata]